MFETSNVTLPPETFNEIPSEPEISTPLPVFETSNVTLPPETIKVSSDDCDIIVSPPSKLVEPDWLKLIRKLAILDKLFACVEPETANPKNPPSAISIDIEEKLVKYDEPL